MLQFSNYFYFFLSFYYSFYPTMISPFYLTFQAKKQLSQVVSLCCFSNPIMNGQQILQSSKLILKQQYSKLNSQMKDLIESDTKSIWVDFPYPVAIDQLSALKKESQQIAVLFDQFREETLCYVNQVMGKIASTMHREIATKKRLQEELEVVKNSNSSMKNQVVQLRQMIEDFVKGYNSEIQSKNKEIMQLRRQIYKDSDYPQSSHSEISNFHPLLDQASEADQESQRKMSLDVIQEVSEYTASVDQTIRHSEISNISAHRSSFPLFSTENQSSSRQNWVQKEPQDKKQENNQSGKKAKSFIKAFRKNMDESTVIQKKEEQIYESHECSMEEDLGDTAKINLPKNIKSPKNLKSIRSRQGRMFTEGSNKENQKSLKMTPTHKRNKSTGRDSNQNQTPSDDRITKSHGKSSSKEKIKLASKIIEETHFSNNHKYTHKKVVSLRPSVHLGGKTYLKKLAKDVRVGLQEYKVWEGCRAKQVKYEGEKKNGMRWGKGKLLYDNGFVYQGSFVQNYRHGVGTISLNGIPFYEGQWSLDELNGQGYIKSMKNYSQHCPKILSEASYCGNLVQNKPNGMGTLFMNQNEKFVAKFVHGVPVGEYTYYNHSQIQFGTWF